MCFTFFFFALFTLLVITTSIPLFSISLFILLIVLFIHLVFTVDFDPLCSVLLVFLNLLPFTDSLFALFPILLSLYLIYSMLGTLFRFLSIMAMHLLILTSSFSHIFVLLGPALFFFILAFFFFLLLVPHISNGYSIHLRVKVLSPQSYNFICSFGAFPILCFLVMRMPDLVKQPDANTHQKTYLYSMLYLEPFGSLVPPR
ncbi:hypothetical protein CFOL_v3_31556 [Cephalotus follicularis]|uniref:Uncharacterized protein n=1 Tax=Cephalotus follicularis TaxID=3775 RepID=A0A1Q3D748_CEPFO|nr:hypothetical protein CFOL_v3_31556 [Cephalotus follicularis]